MHHIIIMHQKMNLNEMIVFDNQLSSPALDNHDSGASGAVPSMVQVLGDVLVSADQALAEISSDPTVLGNAIVRTCQDLAHAVGQLATELEQQSPEERRALADACCDDVQHHHNLQYPENDQGVVVVTTNDMLVALSGASSLLRDVQLGLQSIDRTDADEIATVALVLARLFVASLQSFHSSLLLQQDQQQQQSQSQRHANLGLEFLDEEEDDHHQEQQSTTDATNSNQRQQQQQQQERQRRMERLRVLWPPLGPAVVSACHWGKDEAIRRPILAVVLGMTLWPSAVVAALIGTPVIVADTVMQHAYNSCQQGPVIRQVEQAAFQVHQATKLGWLCTRLVARQSLRVVQSQMQRHGGMESVAQMLLDKTVERILHPVDTIVTAWQGLHWTVGAIHQHWQEWHRHHHHRGDIGRQPEPYCDADPPEDDEWQQ